MAVSSTEVGDGDLLTQLGMLIIQGRKWDSFRHCRTRGVHCPPMKNSATPHHQCSTSNIECQTALSFQNAIQTIWQCNSALTIDVIQLPECGHQTPSQLLEKWSLKSDNGKSTMPKLSLMQAIDSTIHFSQLSSWWASTNGCQPHNVQYRIYEDESSPNSFSESPIKHQFPVCQGIRVNVQYLPRQKSIPNSFCSHCSTTPCIPQHMDVGPVGSPGRGRSFTERGRHRGSRHSSASSDSLSPSINRFDISPYGSPLLSSRLMRAFSSSSSSRGSSRTNSPCISRSPSERNMVLTFEASRHMDEETESMGENVSRNDSGFVDQVCGEDVVLDEDEELANQLDSMSDSDMSDDYVIDGPVGSPGLVGNCVAPPDDARVQLLQNTFGGWHCRRPAFDRLISESNTRTRHSSLDSAVSNMERLDLRTQRRLSRTSSDGQDFINVASKVNNSKDSNKDFFIRDIKKRHKMLSLDMNNSKDCQSRQISQNNNFYAAFCTDSELIWKKSNEPGSISLFAPLDSQNNDDELDFSIDIDSTNLNCPTITPPFLTQSMPCLSMNNAVPSLSMELTHCDTGTLENDQSKYQVYNHCSNDTSTKTVEAGVPYHLVDATPVVTGPWDISYPNSLPFMPTENICQNEKVKNISDLKCHNGKDAKNQADGILSQHHVASGALTCQARPSDSTPKPEDKEDLKESTKQNKPKPKLDHSSSILLRSPPSKLRILPNHCVDKNFLHNPQRLPIHKTANNVQCKPARRLQFNLSTDKPTCCSPAPIRRNNSIRFEFDEDMPNLNQRSSRSMCRGKCMKKDGVIGHNHTRPPNRRLLGSFEESILHECLEVSGTVDGFTAQLGASGSFCPNKVKLPVPVRFFHVSDDNAPSPYMGTMSLKGRVCGKRGYHIPRKGTIQLTLFNPNNSVVKVFVILYDVSNMPPGHRTFLRHRIYSKATAEAPALDCNSNLIEPCSKTQGKTANTTYLRYFVNLWLESSKTNKVYIHGDVKILFSLASNEWDAGNTFELQAETEFPKNPTYSPKR